MIDGEDMMTTNSYERFIKFFNKMDKERQDGLDESYFAGMEEDERHKAYEILKKAFDKGSNEAVKGIKALCGDKCMPLFKKRIRLLRNSSNFSEQRLSIALYLWEFTQDIQYQKDMIQFLNSDVDLLKQTAILYLANTPTTEELINNLDSVISEDNNDTILFVAAEQLLDRYGIKDKDQNTRNLFKKNIQKFISNDHETRIAALKWLKLYEK